MSTLLKIYQAVQKRDASVAMKPFYSVSETET